MRNTRTMAAALLVLAVAVCLLFGSPGAALHDRQLREAVCSLSETEVTLNQIVPFDWDRAYSFGPYTSRAEMEQAIGIKSRALRESVSEGMVQVVFVRGQQVTASICGYPDVLGYRIDMPELVTAAEQRVFQVSRENGIVTLTAK